MTPEKKDCQHPRAKHVHGTWLAYVKDDCGCGACRAAWCRYQKYYRHRRRNGLRTIDGTGTRRRLEALHWLGYSAQAIAQLMGRKNRGSVIQWMSGPVLTETAEEVKRLYEVLSMAPPRPSAAVTQTKMWAKRRGYLPPLAWDDDAIDDPQAQPLGVSRRAGYCSKNLHLLTEENTYTPPSRPSHVHCLRCRRLARAENKRRGGSW